MNLGVVLTIICAPMGMQCTLFAVCRLFLRDELGLVSLPFFIVDARSKIPWPSRIVYSSMVQ